MKQYLPIIFLAALLPLAAAAADAAAEAAADAAAESGETEGSSSDSAELPSFFAATTVTATGKEVDVFDISTPVSVIPKAEIERLAPANAADLLRTQPGTDVDGVGPNQMRPVIRGLRGLRVLFLENGLRLNNPRRQTDFGEIPGLVDIDGVDAVEIVRGPASVLYGTDAIGGVLNLVTQGPAFGDPPAVGGSAGVRYGSAGSLGQAHAAVDGRNGSYAYRLGGSVRDVDDYEAASGSFGNIRLADEAPVVDTGLEDTSLNAQLGYQISDSHQLSLKANRYRADDTGFGFVEPELLGALDPFRIRIRYPFQDFDRYALSYLGAPAGGWADSVDFRLYSQSNERQLANDIDISIGSVVPGAPPSTVEADTLNFTDIDTVGARAELTRGIGDRHLVTWGAEAFEDESFNTDRSVTTTTIRVPFPPFEFVGVSTDTVANAPNATNESWGVFGQDEISIGDRLKVAVGARYQTVETRAEATPGWNITGLDFDDDAFVGSINAIYDLTGYLKLVGSVGTGFRAPNIVERLFNGPTPEGAGFQILNPALTSEQSENIDLGLKYRRQNAVFELIAFRNEISDGIIQDFLTPAEIAQLPVSLQEEIARTGVRFVVQQANAEELRWEGVEVIAGYRTRTGWTLGGNFTHLDGKRLDSTNPPTGDSVSDKLNAWVRWEPPASRYWVEYRLRANGDERANLDPGEPVPPVGEVLPSFEVHTLAAGVTFEGGGRLSHSLGVVLDNLTDELYAEFSNATFFRPQPKRSVTGTYRVRF